MKASEINTQYFLLACKEGRIDAIEEYISDGFDINRVDNDWVSGLLLSIIWWYDLIVDKLLMAWANPNLKDNQWRSPLWWAISFNKPKIVLLLLNKWAKVNDLEEAEIATAKAFGISLWDWKNEIQPSDKEAYKNFANWMRDILMQDPTKGLDKSFESLDKKIDNFGADMEEYNRKEDRVITWIIKPISFIVLFIVVLILILWR